MNTWYITTSDARESLIMDGVTDAEFHAAGGKVVDITRFPMEAQRMAHVHPKVLVLDALDPACADVAIKAMLRVRKIKQEKVRIVLLVPEYTLASEEIIEAAKRYNVRDVVPTNEEELIGALEKVLRNPVDYDQFYATWEEEEADTRGGFFSFGAKPKTVVKEVREIVEVPVEVEKVVETVKVVGTPIITVAGASSKVGTTHLSLSLAATIVYKNSLSCVLITDEETFSILDEFYELENVVEDGACRVGKLGDITLAANAVAGDFSGDVDVIVWDTGVFEEGSLAFKTGDVRVLISLSSEWSVKELHELFQILPKSELKDLVVAFNHASEEKYEELDSELAMLAAGSVHVLFEPNWAEVDNRIDIDKIVEMTGLL